MNRTLLVTKIMLKSSFAEFMNQMGQKKWTKYVGLFFVIVGLTPVIFLSYYLGLNLFKSALQVQQEGYFLGMVMMLITIIIFIFSFLQVPSIYYFSKDTETYLSLPIKPTEILGGRFITTIIYEYSLVFLIYFPMLASYLHYDFNVMKLVIGIIIGILIPIIPVLLASLIIIFMMNFLPFFRNKNTINLLIGLVGIVFAIGINLTLNTGDSTQKMETMHQLLLGNNSLLAFFAKFYPFIGWSAKAIVNISWIDLLLVFVFIGGLVVLYFIFAQSFYLNGVTTVSDGARSKKRFNENQLSNQKNQSVIKLFFDRELKMLIRTPAYLLNLLLANFIGPILIIIYSFITLNNESMQDINFVAFAESINLKFLDPSFLFPVIILGGLFLGLVCSMMNMISITAISREGEGIDHLKVFPIAFRDVLLGKALVGIVVSFLTSVMMTLPVLIIFKINPLVIVGMILISLIYIVGYNILTILIDAKRPKLDWQTEMQAAKQNPNSVIFVFFNMIIIGLLIFLIIKTSNNLSTSMIIGIIYLVLQLVIPTVLLLKHSENFLSKLKQG